MFALSPAVDLELGLYLVAPFGATSVLLFAAASLNRRRTEKTGSVPTAQVESCEP